MVAAARRRPAPADLGTLPVVVQLRPVLSLSEDQFFELCQVNRDLQIERSAEGELLIMPPTGGGTGRRNMRISRRLDEWAQQDGTGDAFDSSTGFRLPNTAVRSPDASWIRRSRLDQVSLEQQERFIPTCPDFVLELCSPTDTLTNLQDKMREYMENGAQLGWLIDPKRKRVYIYCPGVPVEQLDNPDTISGAPVLPGFSLDLREIW